MLEKYDGKSVIIHTFDEGGFEGRATYCDREYCEIEYGRDEEALEIDDWLFYAGDIERIESSSNAVGKVWMGKPQHAMHLITEPFDKIESGSKVYELRLYDEKRRDVRPGDVIRFAREGSADIDGLEDILRVTVTSVTLADSFRELFDKVPLADCGYDGNVSVDEAAAAMGKYYSPEAQRKYKAMAIGIEVI